MEIKKTAGLILISFILACSGGCSKVYQVDFVFEGTIQEKFIKEEMLLIEEYRGEDEGRKEGNIYKIPVDEIEKYEVGQNLKVTVLSNTDADVWDLDHMKFKVEKIEN